MLGAPTAPAPLSAMMLLTGKGDDVDLGSIGAKLAPSADDHVGGPENEGRGVDGEGSIDGGGSVPSSP